MMLKFNPNFILILCFFLYQTVYIGLFWKIFIVEAYMVEIVNKNDQNFLLSR